MILPEDTAAHRSEHLFDFALTDEDMAQIDSRQGRFEHNDECPGGLPGIRADVEAAVK